jgi:hypothetical protein
MTSYYYFTKRAASVTKWLQSFSDEMKLTMNIYTFINQTQRRDSITHDHVPSFVLPEPHVSRHKLSAVMQWYTA